jgi:DNA-binding NtrC family response regulator
MANLLVVDDERDVLQALARALRIAGHSVTMASDAASAVHLSTDHSFDLVVLDYVMPSMSGIALLNRIRAHQPTIRSIIVSGKFDVRVTEESVSAELRDRIEADAYLHKPLENEKLLETITSLLSSNESRSWQQIAERNLNAKKRETDVRDAERSLRKLRRKKKR